MLLLLLLLDVLWAPAVCADAAAEEEAAPEQQQLWRPNMEELNRRLRHEACVQFVRDKHGNAGAAALAAMLFASRHHETQVRADKAKPPAAHCTASWALPRICSSQPGRL